MKIILIVVTILAIPTLVQTEDEEKLESAFVQSLKKLQRGPPEEEITRKADVRTKWIYQKLDHFDAKNNNTWKMRYMVNEEYFEDGGPMFIYFGGEWEISASKIINGIWPDLAKEHKGILFYTEHRYYGKSKPTSNLSIENMQYLHVKQALADLAHFIRTQHETDPRLKNSKVIISGCSYSASMVVWFSKLYPELINGGWASSAPILAQVDFKEYMEIVGQAVRELGSWKCYNRIQNGVAELEAMFASNRSAEAKAMLKLCNSFDHHNDLDLWTLFGTISNLFAAIVQYQSEGDVPKSCDYIMRFEDDLTAIASFFLSSINFNSCIDTTYKTSLSFYLDSHYKPEGSRQWYYQTCNEYGWYQTSSSRNQPFGTKFPSIFYTTICDDTYGPKYTNEYIHKLVNKTNEFFGGKNPQVKNVYMTHGALDPWHAMGHGVLEGASVIPRASHCADVRSISDNDSPEMRASKERLFELVRQWLA